ncbi:MAG: DnaJ domain-containing protein [Nitrosopumilus sp.]|nr:DnaJ domain-containing protein [Nitrosopumilus sp.]
MDPKDYYSILGISENATFSQIKTAYRVTAMKYHPDKNKSPLADDKMKKINEAYDVLSDKQKRHEYDTGKKIEESFRTYGYEAAASATTAGDAKGKTKRKENYHSDYFKGNSSSYSSSSFQKNKYNYSNQKVSVWWHMFYAIIPLVNLWAFFRIQRLEMAITSTLPLLIGIISLLSILPSFSFFPFRFEDRVSIFLILFGGVLAFFIRRWSIMWNEQIDREGYADGNKMDQKVNLLSQLIFAVIPFVNFSAFARICHFGKSIVIGIPTYIVMAVVAYIIVQTTPLSFYPVYLGLTATVFLFFMYRWTIRYNSAKWTQ